MLQNEWISNMLDVKYYIYDSNYMKCPEKADSLYYL